MTDLHKGFDCAVPVTASVLLKAKIAKMDHCIRYFGTHAPKPISVAASGSALLTVNEAQTISNCGFKIISVFESSSDRALSGGTAGKVDAQACLIQAQQVKQPQGSSIIFAIDKDINISNYSNRTTLQEYIIAAKVVLADKYKIGVYAGGAILDNLLNFKLIDVAWLAGAMGWTGSRIFDMSKRWHIKQEISNNNNELGISYDLDWTVDLDQAGAWATTQTNDKANEIDIVDIQQRLKNLGFYNGPLDGNPGPQTCKALHAYYSKRSIT